MLGTLKGRLIVILAVLAASGWYLYSNNGLNLGLDLQGGMHLVLEVADREGTMTDEARADATERALKIIRTRIDEFGVEEPIIQEAGPDRIIVELAGIRDEQRAKEVIQQTAFLEFRLVQSASELRSALPRIDRTIVAELGEEAIPTDTGEGGAAGGADEIQDLLFGTDTAAEAEDEEAAADEEAEDEGAAGGADVEAEADEDEPRPLTSLLLESGNDGVFLIAEEDVPLIERYLGLEAVQRAIPRDVELAFGARPTGQDARLYRELYVLQEEPFITGEDLEDATAGRDQQFGETVVNFEFNRVGGRTFGRVTGRHIGDQIAIVLDGEVYSAPVVQSRITSRGRIELGQAPLEEAQDLALVLRAGALPAPLEIMEERTVGPSLGADSVEQGKVAGIVGVLLVLALMVLYYRMTGVIALGALAVYIVIVLGGLAGLNATLTLPGIAGLILSIGMAVDANVLIFER
ncbi:MAG: protein translocase subunit SecD, partial [Gemmatimonadota bacterium]